MLQQEYERWLQRAVDDPDLVPELEAVRGQEAEIADRFAVELEFGTAGLRGVIGAGTNRMNIYIVRKATQGLANYINRTPGPHSVAISYDSRIKSDVFSKAAAEVLAANGITAHIYDQLRRGHHGHGQPQPGQVQRLQGLRARRLPDDQRGRRRRVCRDAGHRHL